MLHLIKHLHYWTDLKIVIAKSEKELHSENSLQKINSLKSHNCKFIHIASSTDINKAITHENNCLPYVCFVLLFLPLAMVELGPLHHLK